jgi:hypothetical protein
MGALAAALRLGFTEDDFTSRLFDRFAGDQVVILGFTTDGHFSLYRHQRTGLTVPLQIDGVAPGADARQAADLPAHPWVQRAHAFLNEEFDFLGLIGEADFKANLDLILDNIAPQSQVFLLLPPSTETRSPGDPVYVKSKRWVDLRRWIEDAAFGRRNVFLVDIDDYIANPADRRDTLHFSRTVYHRIYCDIVARLDDNRRRAEEPEMRFIEPEIFWVEPV